MSMKLSNDTIEILKNFSQINQSIAVEAGNKLRTFSIAENILAEANVTEAFPQDFAIYDLSEFLGNMSLMVGADMQFGADHHVKITDTRSSMKYFFADPSLIKKAPDDNPTLPSEDVSFTLTDDDRARLIRMAAVNNLPDLSVVGDGEKISVVVRDKENDTSNTYSVNVGMTDDEFVLNMKVENLKIFKGDYKVTMSKRLISCFQHQQIPLTYWIALEPDSN